MSIVVRVVTNLRQRLPVGVTGVGLPGSVGPRLRHDRLDHDLRPGRHVVDHPRARQVARVVAREHAIEVDAVDEALAGEQERGAPRARPSARAPLRAGGPPAHTAANAASSATAGRAGSSQRPKKRSCKSHVEDEDDGPGNEERGAPEIVAQQRQRQHGGDRRHPPHAPGEHPEVVGEPRVVRLARACRGPRRSAPASRRRPRTRGRRAGRAGSPRRTTATAQGAGEQQTASARLRESSRVSNRDAWPLRSGRKSDPGRVLGRDRQAEAGARDRVVALASAVVSMPALP